jgi:hypothetical protein
MSKVKYLLLYGWTFPRVIRVALGLVLIFQTIISGEYLFLIPALLFTAMGIFNFGCCSGWGVCGNNNFGKNTKTEIDHKEISYEEIK